MELRIGRHLLSLRLFRANAKTTEAILEHCPNMVSLNLRVVGVTTMEEEERLVILRRSIKTGLKRLEDFKIGIFARNLIGDVEWRSPYNYM
jgi:hypothetical protein